MLNANDESRYPYLVPNLRGKKKFSISLLSVMLTVGFG